MSQNCIYEPLATNELQLPQPSQKLRAGEPASEQFFNSVYQQYWYKVFRHSYKYTGSKEEAEDMTQEVFINMWQRIDRLSGLKNVEGYLFTMTRNSCHNHYKKELRKKPLYKKYCKAYRDVCIDDAIMVKEINRVAIKAVQRLPEKQKRVYIYRDMGFGRKEIAEIMKVSVNTIDVTMNIAMKKVQQYVSQELHLPTAA